MALLVECNHRSGWQTEQSSSFMQILVTAWGWTGFESIYYLVPVNIAFDFATIYITIIILSKAITKPNYFLLLLICLDILACVALFYNAIYISDKFDTASRVAVEGYWRIIPSFFEIMIFGCSAFHVLTSKVLFVSTILLPTLIYLLMIFALFWFRESFRFLKFVMMHLLEKNVEDKKTIFAHVGTAVGLLTAISKTIIEVAKILSA